MFAAAGSQVRVDDLLRGLVVASGNDAAIALAERVAGSEEAFAALMNQRARELGMTRSHFANTWGGGDPRQRVTARDMARLAAHVIRAYPQFYPYFGEAEFAWNGVRQPNRNPLLAMGLGADGVKTGHLAQSGFGLVGSAVHDGRRLILVQRRRHGRGARARGAAAAGMGLCGGELVGARRGRRSAPWARERPPNATFREPAIESHSIVVHGPASTHRAKHIAGQRANASARQAPRISNLVTTRKGLWRRAAHRNTISPQAERPPIAPNR